MLKPIAFWDKYCIFAHEDDKKIEYRDTTKIADI